MILHGSVTEDHIWKTPLRHANHVLWVVLGTDIVASFWRTGFSTNAFTVTALRDGSCVRFCPELGMSGTVFKRGTIKWDDMRPALAFMRESLSLMVYKGEPGRNCELIVPYFYQWLTTVLSLSVSYIQKIRSHKCVPYRCKPSPRRIAACWLFAPGRGNR